MNFLRTTSTRRLIAGAVLSSRSSSAASPPRPPRAAAARRRPPRRSTPRSTTRSPRPSRRASRPASTSRTTSSPAARCQHRLAAADRRQRAAVAAGDGRLRLELQSDAGDAQITVADGEHLGLRRLHQHRLPRRAPASGATDAAADTAARRPDARRDLRRPSRKLAQSATLSGAEPDHAGRPARLQGRGHAQARRRPARPGGARLGCRQRRAAARRDRGRGQQLAGARARRHRHQLRRVDAGALAVAPPAGAKVVDLGSLGRPAPAADGRRRCDQGLTAVSAAVPFTLAAPDTLVGLPRTGVRLISDGKQPAALVTYGKGLGAIAVLERRAAAGAGRTSPLGGAAAGLDRRRDRARAADGARHGHHRRARRRQLHAGRVAAAERGGGRAAGGAGMTAVVEARGLVKTLRRDHGRRPRRPDRRDRRRLRLPRAERRRQDDVAAHAARADPARRAGARGCSAAIR